MNTARITRTTRRRLAAAGIAAISLTGVAAGLGAGVASAANDQFQLDNLDIIDAPACTAVDHDLIQFVAVPWYNNQTAVRIGYTDGVETCAAQVDLWSYRLPNPEAGIEHPDTVLDLFQSYGIDKLEKDTIGQGGPYNWTTVPTFECWAFRLSVGGTHVATMKLVDECGPLEPVIVLPDPVEPGPDPQLDLDLKDVDPVDPDPQPQHPGDLKDADPVDPDPEHPGDFKDADPVDPEPEHPGDFKDVDPVDPEPEHPGDLKDADPVDPEPEHPGDFKDVDPVDPVDPELPGDADQPGDLVSFGPTGPGAGTEGAAPAAGIERLPTTGAATTGGMIALASLLLGLGAAGVRVARRDDA